MRQSVASVLFVAIVALAAAGCGSDSPTAPTEPPPVAITESLTGTLTVNGLQVLIYTITRAGTTTAQLTQLSDPAATIGLSLGTWNGAACAIMIVNPAATLSTTVTGTAQTAGNFCVLLNDVGNLTAPLDFSVDVTHY